MATLASAAITAARNGAADAVADLVDLGSTNSQGRVILRTAGNDVVATCLGQNPFFGAASGGTATQAGSAVDANAAGNASAVTNFRLVDRNVADIITGSVAESGADINIDDGTEGGGVIIENGATVTLTGLTITFNLV
jgi:hypothetical protein